MGIRCEKGVLMQYLYLVPLCLAIAAVFIVVERMGKYLVADVIKGVASAFFVLLGLLGALGTKDVELARLVLLGLLLGAVADVLLNLRYVYEGSKAQLAFIAGILVFLAGHVAYLFACLPSCPALPFAIVVGMVLTAMLMYWIFGRIEAKVVLKAFGVVYVGAVVILNCVVACVLAANHSLHWIVFFGGTLLFLISDIILILNNFGPKERFTLRVSNLMLYYIGQILIALSLQIPLV